MEELNPVPAWDGGPAPLIQSSWEDMLNDLLQDPDTEAALAGAPDLQVKSVEDLVGLSFENIVAERRDSAASGPWWAGDAAAEPVLDQIGLSDLGEFLVDDKSLSLPGLSSEVSSLPAAEGEHSVGCQPRPGVDTGEGTRQYAAVSSPGSCSSVESDCAPSANSAEEAGILSSRSRSPVVTSCSDQRATSPDAADSSDVGAAGRSCDNFAQQSERRGARTPADLDEDDKRQSRLMRNRESATQSRLRKKSYVKELEAKCRAYESQMNMLHQTVAITSAQTAALREEVAHLRCLGTGSKSGATEPAALPSDSLPSESPSHLTCLMPLVKLELVAFLFHVLLLTLLQALPLKLAKSRGRTPSKPRSERRDISVAAFQIEQFKERLGTSVNIHVLRVGEG